MELLAPTAGDIWDIPKFNCFLIAYSNWKRIPLVTGFVKRQKQIIVV